MRIPTFLLLAFLLASPIAHAGAGAASCYQKTVQLGVEMSQDDAIRLCQGATSDAPARCVRHLAENVDGMFVEEAVALCRGAKSIEPATCVVSVIASNGAMEAEAAIRLCR